jgi:hypothetical protein
MGSMLTACCKWSMPSSGWDETYGGIHFWTEERPYHALIQEQILPLTVLVKTLHLENQI